MTLAKRDSRDALRPSLLLVVLDSVKGHSDSSIKVYKYELAKKSEHRTIEKADAIADYESFTLVTSGAYGGQTLGGGVSVASKRFQRSA